MKTKLVFLGIVFISIISITIFLNNTTENFNSSDSIVEKIDMLKNAFITLKQSTTNMATKKLDILGGPLPVSEIIEKNITNINSLNTTYNNLLNGPNAHDIKVIRDTMQKSINEFIDRYNYINKKLKLKLPGLEKSNINTITTCTRKTVQNMPKLKPATESAIQAAKIDPVVSAIQRVQDAFIALKEDVINSGIKLINTPKGEVQVNSMITENITNLNTLAEKYQTMIQGKKPSDPNFIKKYVQRNLNIFITTYNYITVSLNLKRHKLQKNMILISDSDSENNTIEQQYAPEIPGQNFNKLLSLPLAQLNQILDARLANQQGPPQLQTQMSTHGFERPPILLNKPPVSLPVISKDKLITPPVPKPFSKTFIFDKLSANTQLTTQNSTV
jgi:hypothetical protein